MKLSGLRLSVALIAAATTAGCTKIHPVSGATSPFGGVGGANAFGAMTGTGGFVPSMVGVGVGAGGRMAAPGAGAAGAAGSAAPTMGLTFTCPGCNGLCLIGLCLGGATGTGGAAGAAGGAAGAGGGGAASGSGGGGSGGASMQTPACGDGTVDTGETCDPPSSCPASCDDGNACTSDTKSGSADTCDVACAHTAITACANGDACCPAGCNANTDSDCSVDCGNGVQEANETCDPPASCPASCDDSQACTVDMKTGSADTCNVACSHTSITACTAGDGCCPSGCNQNIDADCSASCGNGAVETGETCDPPSSCASISCEDHDACTIDMTMGGADTCNVACAHNTISACTAGDGCCAGGCGPTTDSDCPGCGNGRVEAGLGETCDGNCPACDDGDACTVDTSTGSAGTCDLVCTHSPISTCDSNATDGCCPGGCGPTTDSDCAGCGNGRIEANLGETCDPPDTCTCEDNDPCTLNVRSGTPSNCDVTCEFRPITECSNTGDSCCPSGCDSSNDADCPP